MSLSENTGVIASTSMINCGLRLNGYSKTTRPDKPLLTVITVVFNGVHCLEKTILSVIRQTYNNIEYIIIDGGSTDGTVDIIKKYEGQIDYWISEKDEGIYDAMNKAVAVSTGEWINFMNSGDSFYDDNTIELIFNQHINGSVIYGNTLIQYSPEHNKIRKPSKKLKFKYGLPFCHQSAFVKTKILNANKFSEAYKIYADFDLFAKLAKNGVKFTYVDITISTFNCDGISTAKSLSHLKELYEIKKKLNLCSATILILDVFLREVIKKLLPAKLVRQIQVSK